MRRIFEKASINSDVFDIYESCPKMKIYQLLSGSRISLDLKYEERKAKKEKQIKQYVDDAVDKSNCFKMLFSICKEASKFKTITYICLQNDKTINLKIWRKLTNLTDKSLK